MIYAVFIKSVFVFVLPVCLLVYFLIHRNRVLSNVVLTVFSCWFYAYGEPKFIVIMLLLTTVDWLAALVISKGRTSRIRTSGLVVGISLNLLVLFIFKYLDFVNEQINVVFKQSVPLFHIALPIGISFFTFQSVSYIIDVYQAYLWLGDGTGLQEIKNLSNSDGPKLIMFRDSFASAMVPFLAHYFSEIDLIDFRYHVPEDLESYILGKSPDLIMVMYNPDLLGWGVPFGFNCWEN